MVRFNREYGSVLGYSDDRHAPVDAGRLVPCGRPLYAESALAPAPDSIIMNLRIFWGPQWEVVMCEDSVQKAVISVGVFATALATFDFNAPTGGAAIELINVSLHFRGLPVDVRYPVSAEEAAARAFSATGRRVSALPRLLKGRIPLSPWWTLWSVELDSAVVLRGAVTGRQRTRSTVLWGVLPASRWEMTVADATNDELGPYLTSGEVVQPGGSFKTVPVVLGRQHAPSFSGAEAVTRVVP